MKIIKFSQQKDESLKIKRKIGFSEIVEAIENNRVLKTVDHPNKKKFPRQKIMLVKIKKYIYAVPYVEEENEIFLKTIYPSRKYTKELKIKS